MFTLAFPSTRLRRSATTIAAAAAAILLLAGCAQEPAAPAPSGTGATPPVTAEPSPSQTPSPTPTEPAEADTIELPASCDDIYSPAMRAQLEAGVPPLNDPGISMPSTQNAQALQLLESGIPSLRCTWGYPSEVGIATTVSLIEPAAAGDLAGSLANAGFSCADAQGGTACRLTETLVDYDDNLVEKGETHFFRGNGWLATVWLNYGPEGYTEDIASMIWG
ncbi:hypothetical protein NQ166_05220 [Microbacterium sp. zg.Y1090]|uniref:hypothetical protein n=1 Tax=Microbacterium wangruii TaxID=3049073 RepID=UPI00214ABB56|nr:MULTISPECIES: hypothetical protein [unclassified Microbacterium]MCR2818235.1 hypothetical protein [Microbacterium sp. zg.Y1090]WIM27617.1 hypothetical protein QNO26_10695 [Microbacterium sp. zg-Y1090]